MKKTCKNCKWSKIHKSIKGVQATGVCYHESHDGKIILPDETCPHYHAKYSLQE